MDMDSEVILHLPEDVHKLCRTCMSVTENLLCHDIVLIESNEKTVAGEMFQFCFAKIECEDGLPKSICEECANTLEVAYNFKNQCEQTEINLRKILNLPTRENVDRKPGDIFNKECQSHKGIQIHDNSSSFPNYIDNTIEIEDTEITVETLFQKMRECNLIHISDEENSDESASLNEIKALIEERKEDSEFNKEEIKTAKFVSQIAIKEETLSDDETNREICCKLCDEVFSSLSEFSVHSSENCKNKLALENILKTESNDIEQINVLQEDEENKELLPFHCTICDTKFRTRQAKNAHMASHEKIIEESSSKDAPYSCDLCNKIFMTESKLAIHFYKHASHYKTEMEYNGIPLTIKDNLTCTKCNDTFESKDTLIEHSKKHTKTGKVSCEICHLDFIGEINLVKHLKNHGIHILLCRICLKRFEHTVKFREHMKTHLIESMKNVFKCPLCKSEFNDVETLKIHSLEHLDDIYECAKCRKTFHNKVAYENHEKQHNEPRFLCSLCGKQYFSGVTLACHIRAHNNEKPFVCQHCGKGFSSRATLSVHKRIHSSYKPYICSYCGYSCRQSGDLAMHIRTHTGDKPYKCTFPNCDRKFTTSSQRKEHYRRHTNERNHKCKVCGKAFLESKTLKVHMLVHTGEKPHTCQICSKRFRRTHHLTNHMKGHRESILGM